MNSKKFFTLLLALLFIGSALSGCTKATEGGTASRDVSDNIAVAFADYNDKYIGDNKGEEYEEDDGLLQEPLGASGKKVYEYDGFLGYGYNIIDSPYYRSEDVRQCVLDVESMAEDGLIYEERNSQTSTSFSVDSGETIHTYMNNLAVSAGMSTKSLFGGSLKVDFGLETSSKVDENKSFAKGSATLTRTKQYVHMSKISYKTLRSKYVYDSFKEDFLLNENYSPADLFKEFGTHIMLTVYLGGRLDMCYVYNNTQKESAMDISTKVEASFSLVEGRSSTETKEKTTSLVKNSATRIKTYGGRVDINMTSLENAKEHYEEWAKSIQDAEYQVLIKAGRLDSTAEMFPIWMLIDPESSPENKRRYEAILAEFNKQLEEAGKNLSKLQKEPQQLYVKDIYIGAKTGRNGDLAVSDLLSKTSEPVTIIRKDLNQNAGGDFIYLGYTTTANPDEAIRGLVLRFEEDCPQTMTYNGSLYYKRNEYDLNKGAGGYDIYLYYTKDKNAGNPLKELFVEINGDSSGKTGTGWTRVADWQRPESYYDLNKGAGGADIFLWMQR